MSEINVVIKRKTINVTMNRVPVSVGAGDMEASVYDPQVIEGDAFDRANHTGTQAESTITSKVEYAVISLSDEITDLVSALPSVTARVPFTGTITGVRADVNSAPVGSTIIVDINKNGTTILSTKLTIDENEETSVTAAVPPVISDNVITDNDEFTFDIDQVGLSTPGKGLKLTLIMQR
jgi:hypothetical protein